jgi:hypothetical protein
MLPSSSSNSDDSIGHERQLPAGQPRARGDRFRVGAHVGRHGQKDDAARRDLVQKSCIIDSSRPMR